MKKNVVYFIEIACLVPEILMFFEYANWETCDVETRTQNGPVKQNKDYLLRSFFDKPETWHQHCNHRNMFNNLNYEVAIATHSVPGPFILKVKNFIFSVPKHYLFKQLS